MLSEKMADAINAQIRAEFESAHLYLAMEAYFQSQGLAGFGNWMRVQYREEVSHALKFFDYLSERGARAVVSEMSAPQKEWTSPLHAMEETLRHEQYVTSRINNLVNLAMDERDHASVQMLQWYVVEQVEEEASVQAIIDQLRLTEGQGNGLFMIDRELKQRVFVDATAAAQ